MTALPPHSAPAQQGPPASLVGIPTERPAGRRWYREHGHRPADPDGGCWYYATLPADPAAGGRFDVPDPDGTCYFANEPSAAAMERVGRYSAQHKPVPADLVDGRVVTAIDTASLPAEVVDLLAPAAATHFGITGELFTMSDYSVPQAWAAALRRDGHDALIYTPRFSPSSQAVAAFGPRGTHPQPIASRQPLRAVLAEAGVPVERTPSASELRIVPPSPTPTKP